LIDHKLPEDITTNYNDKLLAFDNNYGPVGKDNLDKYDTWCTIFVNDVKTTALVRHLGRGKFKVINDPSDGSLIGKIIDASDIYHC
jgi:hypothetical protein